MVNNEIYCPLNCSFYECPLCHSTLIVKKDELAEHLLVTCPVCYARIPLITK